jgi:hypothetical protein
MEKRYSGVLPSAAELSILKCITGEQSQNKLIASSRGALWKLQVDVDQKQ